MKHAKLHIGDLCKISSRFWASKPGVIWKVVGSKNQYYEVTQHYPEVRYKTKNTFVKKELIKVSNEEFFLFKMGE